MNNIYTLSLKENFKARHYLLPPREEQEGQPHIHHYKVGMELAGNKLNSQGYLVDILDVEKQLKQIITYFNDQLLNELPEFKNLNPSLEHLARVFYELIIKAFKETKLLALTVSVDEDWRARVSYRKELP